LSRRKNKKPIEQNVKLERYAAEGKSVGVLESGKTVFVSNGIPGDVVNIRLTKNKSSFAEGEIIELVEASADRVEPFCPHFSVCGGCKWQMLPYHKQLEYKSVQVSDQLHRLAKIDLPEIAPIIGSDTDKFYRNKLEFTFSALRYLTREEIQNTDAELSDEQPVLGFHAPKLFDKVVDIQECYLMSEPQNAIRNFLRAYAIEHNLEFYNARTQQGFLRNVIIRITTLGQVMVNVIVKQDIPELHALLEALTNEFPTLTSVLYTINDKVNDTIYDLEVKVYKGQDYIEEKLEDFVYKISPKSFFQTNSRQAEKLYQVVRDFAGLTGEETIYDLYCGTGSIGLFLSQQVKKIVGIEAVDDAIKDARINASINGIDNTTYLTGDVIKVIDDQFYHKYGYPDVIITDPPRAGMHQEMVDKLLEIACPRIVYVSCNPATQARDLQLLDAKYKVLKVQPVDMFPHTHHIECVALLELK